MRRTVAVWALRLSLLASAPATFGCDGQPGRPAPRLWTLDDFVALAQGERENDPEAQLPALMPLDMVLADGGADRFHLTLGPAMLGGLYDAAYVTTDVWEGFDEVWVQPIYVLISGWSPDGTPMRFPAGDLRARPIFTVGPESAFYSPFWQTFYVVIAADTPPERYRSAREISGDKSLVLTPGPARVASLLRRNGLIQAPVADRDRYPSLPPPEEVGPVKLGVVGYLDGAEIEYVDLGEGGFQWNRELVVEETPLFIPMWRDPAGVVRPMEVPTIAGTGPLFSNRPARFLPDRPHYGAYWRFYLAVMPPTARVFAPPQFVKVQDALRAAQIPVADVAADIKALPAAEVRSRVGRVALDGAFCFASVAALNKCTWLNSQAAVEMYLPESSLQKTDITVTCPFVSYASVPVSNP